MRAHQIFGVLAAAVVSSTACSGSGAHVAQRPTQSAAAWYAALNRPGACGSVLALRAGRVVASRVAGVGPQTPDTALFDIGSAAKSLTAVAVLRLVERRQLDLSASVGRYLPDVPVADRSITPAQLLSHTSGLPENFTGDKRQLTRAAAVREILALTRGSPGQFSYSNAGYTLLAAIVERVSHQPFRTFVQREVLAPAQMNSTGWYGTAPAGTTPVHGHVDARDTGPAGTQAPASWATLGAGGMTSTSSDLARWLTAITSGTELTPAATTVMFTPRVSIGQPGASAAYGWIVGTTPAGPVRLVGGDTDYGYTSDLRILPRQSVVTVALSCSAVTPANELGHDLQVSST